MESRLVSRQDLQVAVRDFLSHAQRIIAADRHIPCPLNSHLERLLREIPDGPVRGASRRSSICEADLRNKNSDFWPGSLRMTAINRIADYRTLMVFAANVSSGLSAAIANRALVAGSGRCPANSNA